MCEVCVEANQPETFNDHYNQLVMLGDSVAISQADELRGRLDFSDVDFGSMAPEDYGSDDFSSEIGDPEPSQESTPDYTDTLDFDLSSNEATDDIDLEQESDTGLDFDLGDLEDTGTNFAPDDTSEIPEAGPQQDKGLDFELDLDEKEETSAAESNLVDHDSNLSDEADFSSLDYDAPENVDLEITSTEEATPNDLDASDDSELNADSASKLADELDLDLDSDFLGETVEQDSILDDSETTETPINDLDSFDTEALSPAANEYANAEDELDFLSEADESSTKLDLARAYIDMGDREGAKDILDEVMHEGNDDQKTEAKDLLVRLESWLLIPELVISASLLRVLEALFLCSGFNK